MYFGPWIMEQFDKKIKNTCGDEIYLNRTYTGIAAKENYTALAYNNKDIDFGTGVDTERLYKPVAFGTGIGDRKVLGRPQFSWNAYKNSSKKMPKWYNGNYVNIPGLVQTDGYWNEESSLGGTSMSFWDAHQKVLNDDSNPLLDNNGKKVEPQNENTVLGFSEGFTVDRDIHRYGDKYNNKDNYENYENYNDNSTSCGCKKFEWNWVHQTKPLQWAK